MLHQHNHDHHHNTANIRTAFFLNLGFALFEAVGGLWTNSMAIFSDALHDLGDSISLGVTWYLDRYSTKGEDEKFSYGYRRFSLLGALANTVILIGGSLFVLTEAIPRLLQPQPANASGMVIFAIVGILVNGVAALRLKGARSLNARVVAWHMVEDVLSWAAVLVVSIVLLFKEIYILDALLSIVITLYILYNVFGNLKKTLNLFLQGVPEDVDIKDLEERIRGIEQVSSVHHTHVWSLDGDHHILTTHVAVDCEPTVNDQMRIKNEIKRLTADHEFEHMTVEIEYQDEDCSMRSP